MLFPTIRGFWPLYHLCDVICEHRTVFLFFTDIFFDLFYDRSSVITDVFEIVFIGVDTWVTTDSIVTIEIKIWSDVVPFVNHTSSNDQLNIGRHVQQSNVSFHSHSFILARFELSSWRIPTTLIGSSSSKRYFVIGSALRRCQNLRRGLGDTKCIKLSKWRLEPEFFFHLINKIFVLFLTSIWLLHDQFHLWYSQILGIRMFWGVPSQYPQRPFKRVPFFH